MNILLHTLSDPIWQILALVLTLATPLLVIAVRTRDVHVPVQQRKQETLCVLGVCLAAFFVMSAWVALAYLPGASSPHASTLPTSTPRPSPTPSPTPTPTFQPTPTPTPRLAHSITQVLMTFCEAINAQDYQTAWSQYARSLQRKHPEAETAAAWRMFSHCRIPDQSGDPGALTILTLTLANGYTDRFGRSGEVNYRFMMGVEDNAWKVTSVCDILSEGCFVVSWG